ncbi:DUF29 family protein [Methylobacterium oryzae CBMB20]
MDRPSLYDDDIVTWAEEQAAALRALAERPDLSNAVDWENVAEEIESVGRSHLRALEGPADPDARPSPQARVRPRSRRQASHWREEIATLPDHRTGTSTKPSMRQRLNWNQDLEIRAITAAEAGLGAYGNTLLPGLPVGLPRSALKTF